MEYKIKNETNLNENLIQTLAKYLIAMFEKKTLSIANIIYGKEETASLELLLFIEYIFYASNVNNKIVISNNYSSIIDLLQLNTKDSISKQDLIYTHYEKLSILFDVKIFYKITIQDVRLIHQFLNTFSWNKYKIIIIYSQDLNDSCANALLKLLESSLKYVYIFFITENLNNILPTIASRCQTYLVHNFAQTNLINHNDAYNIVVQFFNNEISEIAKTMNYQVTLKYFLQFINKILKIKNAKTFINDDILSGCTLKQKQNTSVQINTKMEYLIEHLTRSEKELLSKININNILQLYFYIINELQKIATFNLDEKTLYNLIKCKLYI